MPDLLNEHASAGSMMIQPTLAEPVRYGGRQEVRFGAPLSFREGQIVKLIFGGLSNKEIADALLLSEGTIKVYIARVFVKMGFGSRCELMARRIAELEAALIRRESGTASSTSTTQARSK